MTGGGKTEAYLGVIGFTLLLRRLRGQKRPDAGLVLIGESQFGRVVLVVFTERAAGGIIRIISVRRATKPERRAYAEAD